MTLTSLPIAAPAIPKHPDTTVSASAEIIFTIFLGIPVVVMLYFAIRFIVQGKGPLFLMCLIGGGIACLYEPIVDVLGLAYMREGAMFVTFSSFGRDFPLYINFVYIWYVGGLAFLAYRIFSNGVTKKGLFVLYGMDVCINIGLESPGVLLGAYEYYGPQPLNFWGLPLWWVCVNPLMPLLAGALIYRLKPYFTGWRILAVIPIIPMADGVGNGATAWPMWTSLNLNAPTWVTHITWAVTLSLALFFVWMLSHIVARPEDEVPEAVRSKKGIVRAALFGLPEGTVPPKPVTIPGGPAQPAADRAPAPAPGRAPTPA